MQSRQPPHPFIGNTRVVLPFRQKWPVHVTEAARKAREEKPK